MAITAITGAPGAGKTYLAVSELLRVYYETDGGGGYRRKEKYQGHRIVTNINGLKLPHIPLETAMGGKTFDQYFTKENQEKETKEHGPSVYVLDECQQFLHRKFYNLKVFLYFETHRHLGHDIWLISQDYTKICKDVFALVETETRATKRTFSVAGEMSYRVMSAGEVSGRKVLRPKKEVYDLYKSMSELESVKQKRPALFLIGVPVVLGIIMLVVLVAWVRWNWLGGREAKQKEVSTAETQARSGVEPTRQQQQSRALWYPVSGWIIIDNNLIGLVDPVTDRYIEATLYEGRIRFGPGYRSCAVQVTAEEMAAIEQREKEKEGERNNSY